MASSLDSSVLSCEVDKDAIGMEALKDFSYWFEEYRRRTFTNWPFCDTDKCNPDAMAQAGFIHCPTTDNPDAARCFYCLKELDGWEPDDDPWDEHLSHTKGKCSFLSHAKEFETDLSTKKFLNLELKRQQNIVTKLYEKKIEQVKVQAAAVRDTMQDLV